MVLLLVVPLGQAVTSSQREYRLRFYHTHTNERLDIVYRRGDTYLPDALAAQMLWPRSTTTSATIVRERSVISTPACSTCSTT